MSCVRLVQDVDQLQTLNKIYKFYDRRDNSLPLNVYDTAWVPESDKWTGKEAVLSEERRSAFFQTVTYLMTLYYSRTHYATANHG